MAFWALEKKAGGDGVGDTPLTAMTTRAPVVLIKLLDVHH